jgi:hypothetical protein
VKQLWFAGVHCDVGGGYAEAESGLSKIALQWMLDEARAFGLRLEPLKVAELLGSSAKYSKPDPNAMAHESLKGAWNLAEFVPKKHWNWKKERETRRMNLYDRRTVPPSAVIHDAVFSRGNNYADRLPKGVKRASQATAADWAATGQSWL